MWGEQDCRGETATTTAETYQAAPTFLPNHPASQRTKHFYQCLYLVKQWQVGCQGSLWPCYRCTTPQRLHCHAELLPLWWVHKWQKTCWSNGTKYRHRYTVIHERLSSWVCVLTYTAHCLCCDPRGLSLQTGPWWSKSFIPCTSCHCLTINTHQHHLFYASYVLPSQENTHITQGPGAKAPRPWAPSLSLLLLLY